MTRKLFQGLVLKACAGLMTALPLCFMSAQAGEGHDHGDAPAAPSANGPQRQPDGSVFLPKPAQRQLGVRTMVTVLSERARTHELMGKVVMDPNAGGKVQAMNAGRVAPGPQGLPSLGQRVQKGQVLAYVQPSVAAVERANQAAQWAELRAAKQLADKRLARLRELVDTVPRKDIEAAEADVQSLAERVQAIGSGLSTRETLVAPVSGVVASSQVVAGQVVDARELLFEVVDPTRLRVEALTYEPALASQIASASMALGEQRIPLALTGVSRSLREQALPLNFSAQADALSQLALGEPVRVFVHTQQALKAVAVPVAALMKNPANQTIVWVKTAPERFEPRVVTTLPLDGVHVAVTAGLSADERVATAGASLINQVR